MNAFACQRDDLVSGRLDVQICGPSHQAQSVLLAKTADVQHAFGNLRLQKMNNGPKLIFGNELTMLSWVGSSPSRMRSNQKQYGIELCPSMFDVSPHGRRSTLWLMSTTHIGLAGTSSRRRCLRNHAKYPTSIMSMYRGVRGTPNMRAVLVQGWRSGDIPMSPRTLME